MFQTTFGYVLGEIYPKNVKDKRNQFQEKVCVNASIGADGDESV